MDFGNEIRCLDRKTRQIHHFKTKNTASEIFDAWNEFEENK